MVRTKVDNKLNVVVGTKEQILADTSIPENSIIITTDENEQATNVEYDNGASGLNADNVQDAIDETLDLKLNKVFSSLVEQTTINLTDVFVLNRGGVAYRTTLANMLTNVNQGSIFKVVSILPSNPEPADINKIFLVPTEDPEMPNYYEEWIWVDYTVGWEKIGVVTVDLSNYYNKTQTDSLLTVKLDKNASITGATKTKITYDSKGLVTGGADLIADDIPTLPATKITQTSTARFVTDTEKSTWNGKQNALTNVTTAEIVTGTATTQKTVTAKAVHDAIMQIMFDSLEEEY